MSLINDLKCCMVCKSTKENIKYSGVVEVFNPVTDRMVECESVQCTECDTVHFYVGEKISYQFYPTITYGRKMF
jgi:hypothetical protein